MEQTTWPLVSKHCIQRDETVTGPVPLEAAVRWRRQRMEVWRGSVDEGWAAAVSTQPLLPKTGRRQRQRTQKEFAR